MRTNSLVNLVVGQEGNPVPEVGMGATELCWTDRHAFTIIEVLSPKEIRVQQDFAERADANGMSESQEYTYSPDPNGRTQLITLRKNGAWVTKGKQMQNGTRFKLGVRMEYYDYSF